MMATVQLKEPHVLRIFFSSPFNGMGEERESLTKLYWPQIQSLSNSKGIQFVPVDMRWGITTEQSSSAQTVNICLREIDRSDMFVGFFGQVCHLKYINGMKPKYTYICTWQCKRYPDSDILLFLIFISSLQLLH